MADWLSGSLARIGIRYRTRSIGRRDVTDLGELSSAVLDMSAPRTFTAKLFLRSFELFDSYRIALQAEVYPAASAGDLRQLLRHYEFLASALIRSIRRLEEEELVTLTATDSGILQVLLRESDGVLTGFIETSQRLQNHPGADLEDLRFQAESSVGLYALVANTSFEPINEYGSQFRTLGKVALANLQATPGLDSQTLIRLGHLQIRVGDFASAIEVFQVVLLDRNVSGEVRLNLVRELLADLALCRGLSDSDGLFEWIPPHELDPIRGLADSFADPIFMWVRALFKQQAIPAIECVRLLSHLTIVEKPYGHVHSTSLPELVGTAIEIHAGKEETRLRNLLNEFAPTPVTYANSLDTGAWSYQLDELVHPEVETPEPAGASLVPSSSDDLEDTVATPIYQGGYQVSYDLVPKTIRELVASQIGGWRSLNHDKLPFTLELMVLKILEAFMTASARSPEDLIAACDEYLTTYNQIYQRDRAEAIEIKSGIVEISAGALRQAYSQLDSSAVADSQEGVGQMEEIAEHGNSALVVFSWLWSHTGSSMDLVSNRQRILDDLSGEDDQLAHNVLLLVADACQWIINSDFASNEQVGRAARRLEITSIQSSLLPSLYEDRSSWLALTAQHRRRQAESLRVKDISSPAHVLIMVRHLEQAELASNPSERQQLVDETLAMLERFSAEPPKDRAFSQLGPRGGAGSHAMERLADLAQRLEIQELMDKIETFSSDTSNEEFDATKPPDGPDGDPLNYLVL